MTAHTVAAAQGQTTPAAHVEIGNDSPGQIYVGESRGQAGRARAGARSPD